MTPNCSGENPSVDTRYRGRTVATISEEMSVSSEVAPSRTTVLATRRRDSARRARNMPPLLWTPYIPQEERRRGAETSSELVELQLGELRPAVVGLGLVVVLRLFVEVRAALRAQP